MMSDLATGCSSEGRNGLPLTLPTTHHKKTYFTHQSKQIPCIRMALIVDFEELDKKMYESFIQEKYISDSLVFTAEIQAELTRQFQQPNTRGVRTILQERWLVKYNELIEYNELNKDTSDSVMPGKLNDWVLNQRTQYRFLQENKKSHMTAERFELLEANDFMCKLLCQVSVGRKCCVEECQDQRRGSLYCKKHSDQKNRCRKCNRRDRVDGSSTLCSHCNLLCRKTGCENRLADFSSLCSDCNLLRVQEKRQREERNLRLKKKEEKGTF